jgi:hypothetical protein
MYIKAPSTSCTNNHAKTFNYTFWKEDLKSASKHTDVLP